MKKLTTEQLQHIKLMAEDAAKTYGGEWDSALVGNPAGNYHAITSEHTNDVVVRTADGSLQSSWLCDYLEAVSPNAVIKLIDEVLAGRKP